MQAHDREFAEALREAIEARGLSLDRVRAHLLAYGHDVSVATLSYWQTGRSVPLRRASLQALGALEAILGVPRGRLAARLPSQKAARPPGTDPAQAPAMFSIAGQIADELGVALHEGYEIAAQSETIYIDEHRAMTGAELDTVVVATRDGLDRIALWYSSDIPGVLLDVSALAGCRVGRSAAVLSETLSVTEFLLDQPLRAGEPYRYRTCAQYDTPGVRVREWARLYHRPAGVASLTVRFLGSDVPACWGYAGSLVKDPAYTPLAPFGTEVTLHRTDLAGGMVGITWAWDDDDQVPSR